MEAVINTSYVANVLYPVFEQYNVKKAILFGSVAKGTAVQTSDVDILVDSNLKGLRFIGLLEDIKRAVKTDVDLLDISHIEKGSAVEKEIQKTGVIIYEK